jgi:hypothetical protein
VTAFAVSTPDTAIMVRHEAVKLVASAWARGNLRAQDVVLVPKI